MVCENIGPQARSSLIFSHVGGPSDYGIQLLAKYLDGGEVTPAKGWAWLLL